MDVYCALVDIKFCDFHKLMERWDLGGTSATYAVTNWFTEYGYIVYVDMDKHSRMIWD